MDGFVELTTEKLASKEGLAEINRMLREIYDNVPGDGNTVRIFKGYGSPENFVSASIGSLYQRLDGGATTTLYVKTSGTAAVGWTAK